MTWLFHDTFTTPAVAPLDNPKTSEVGQCWFLDPNNRISQIGGTLVVGDTEETDATEVSFEPAGGGTHTKQDGLAFGWLGYKVMTNGIRVGLSASRSSYLPPYGFDSLGGVYILDNASIATPVSFRNADRYVLIWQPDGNFLYVCNDELVWVGHDTTTTPQYMLFTTYTTRSALLDEAGVTTIGSPWNTNYGLASDSQAGSISVTRAFTHEQKFIFHVDVDTLPSADEIQIRCRIQDASNYYLIAITSAGAIRIDEYTAGVPTNINTSTFAAGNKLTIYSYGSLIYTYQGKTRKAYGTCSKYTTSYSGEITSLGTGGALSDMYLYPVTLSGAALAEIDTYFNCVYEDIEIYCATDGTAASLGTLASPLNQTVATHLLRPGVTLNMLSGVYTDALTLTYAVGTASQHIIVKAYDLDNLPTVPQITGGTYVELWDIVVNDTVTFAGGRPVGWPPVPPDVGTDGIAIGNGCEYYYCHVKNNLQGFAGANNYPYIIHGCLCYFNGFDDDHGHNAYLQHQPTTNWAEVYNSLFFFGFGNNLKFYGSHPINNVKLHDCVSWCSGYIRGVPWMNFLYNGVDDSIDVEILRNYTYMPDATSGGGSIRVYFGDVTNTGVIINDNIAHGGAEAMRFVTYDPDECEGNQIYGTIEGFTEEEWPDNTYGLRTALPDQVIVIDDTVRPTRATLVVYNMQAQADDIEVDLTYTFGLSGTVYAHNAQDYFSDVQELTMDRGVITINMEAANRTIESPVGWTDPDTTFPDFGCFILVFEQDESTIPVGEYEMAYSMFDIVLAVGRELDHLVEFYATSGSTLTAVDTSYLAGSFVNDYFNQGQMLVIETTDGLAPQGEWTSVYDFVSSTGVVTFTALLTAAVGAGDYIGLLGREYRMSNILGQLNRVLQMLRIPKRDETLTTAGSTLEYSLPTDCRTSNGPLEVWTQRDPYATGANNWTQLHDWYIKKTAGGTADLLVFRTQPDPGKTLSLRYYVRHDAMNSADDNLDESVNFDLVVMRTAVRLLQWRKRQPGAIAALDEHIEDLQRAILDIEWLTPSTDSVKFASFGDED